MNKLKKFGPALFVGAIVVAVYYFLKNYANNATPPIQQTAPAVGTGGGTVYQVGRNVPSASPNLLFEAPPLPPTPSYQNINNSPFITLMNGPAGAAATPGKKDASSGDSCGCGGGCGCEDQCGGANTRGNYTDGNGTTLAGTPAKQAGSMTQRQVNKVALKIASLGAVGGADYSQYAAGAALNAQRNQDLLNSFQSDVIQ